MSSMDLVSLACRVVPLLQAADILQELLAQQPNDGRAKEALLLLGLLDAMWIGVREAEPH